MNQYDFLEKYIQSLPSSQRKEYVLNKGIPEEEMRKLQEKSKVDLPDELKEFYRFSYGATLSEYKILKIPEIVQAVSRMKTVYDDMYDASIIPFAQLLGVGDFMAFDTRKSNEDGLSIVDCFHEYPPNEWKGIGFGLRSWLKEMVRNDFRPYWL